MSVLSVRLTGVDERYSPPDKEIEVSVVGDGLFITVYDGSLDDLTDGRKKEFQVPEMSLREFRAILDFAEKYEDTYRR